MPPRNKAKLGLTIPNPRYRIFDPLTPPSTSSSAMAALPSSSRRNVLRSPRPIPAPPPAPTRKGDLSRHYRDQAARKKAETEKLDKEEAEELENLVHAPPFSKTNKNLSKQLSMRETSRDMAWEKRRREILRQERRRCSISVEATRTLQDTAPPQKLKDADLHELKGSIELGFGFNEEDGQRLCNTLPALDLYFAVNRKYSLSPVSTPRPTQSTSLDSSKTDESWSICGPGDDPQQVKTKLRHWAQAVACSIMQTL